MQKLIKSKTKNKTKAKKNGTSRKWKTMRKTMRGGAGAPAGVPTEVPTKALTGAPAVALPVAPITRIRPVLSQLILPTLHANSIQEIPDPDSFEKPPLNGFIYIGSEITAAKSELLHKHGITHILNFYTKQKYAPNAPFTVLHLPMDDSPKQSLFDVLQQALMFIEDAQQKSGKIFVHCQAGISRSVAIVMCYLIWVKYASSGKDTTKKPSDIVTEIYDIVRAYRSCAAPNFNFSGQIKFFADSLPHKPYKLDRETLSHIIETAKPRLIKPVADMVTKGAADASS